MSDFSFVDFFRKSLHLPSEWVIEGVRMDEARQCVLVDIGYRGAGPIYDHEAVREWRHLDVCQYQTFIVARLPRVRSSSGKIAVVPAPWASPMQRVTDHFEHRVITVVQTVKHRAGAGRLLQMTPEKMDRICTHALVHAQQRHAVATAVSPVVVRYLSIDETCYAYPRRMATVVTDLERQQVLAVTDGHTQASAEKALRMALLPEQCEQLLAISMDLWAPFGAAARKVLPNARIVYDKYHLIQLQQKAIDQTRRQEVQKHPELIGKRFWLLRGSATRPPKHQAFFEAIHNTSMVTAITYQAVEDFRGIYRITDPAEARNYLHLWLQRYVITPITPLRRLAETVESHVEGIVNYFHHRITNARAERTNGKIKEIMLLAKGFRDFKSFRNAVLFYLGGFDLYPHLSR